MRRVGVICNSNECDLGIVGNVLDELGFVATLIDRATPQSWRSGVDLDLYVHLGSSWSVYWDSVKLAVAAEVALMKSAISRGTPVLGICFGAQVMSHAFGGNVDRGQQAEIGWFDVVSTTKESVLAGRWMQWHYDSFTAPRGFEVLATNEAGIQAIRRGRSLGVQFHPEATEAIVSKWVAGDGAVELAAAGISATALLDQTRIESTRTLQATRQLTNWFLEEVAQYPASTQEDN